MNYSDSDKASAFPEYGKRRSNDPNGKYKYGDEYPIQGGSTAYWMQQLSKIIDGQDFVECDIKLSGKPQKRTFDKNEIIYEVISAIDRENSTHLTADKNASKYEGAGRKELSIKIARRLKSLREILRDRKKGMKLIDKLAEKTADGNGRQNYSFATKFCHYACFYLLQGLPEQDNYSIYDDVLGKSLPAYMEYYKLNKYTQENFKSYKIYSEVIDAIREKAAIETGYLISRNGFDHLLWYYHKGHPIQK